MRANLSIFILFVAFIQVSGESLAQNITLNEKDASLNSVFRSISQQTGYFFIYNTDDLIDANVDVYIKNATIQEAMQACLKDLPFTFKIVKNNVLVKRREINKVRNLPSVKSKKLSRVQEKEIRGKVVDENGEPLVGVSVIVKGTLIGSATDTEGSFSLSIEDNNATLVFSFIGFASQEITINGLSQITVVMEEDLAKLDEVVVIGYGTAKKRDLTGSVAQVNATKLENETPKSMQDILRGNIVGLNVGFSATAKGGGSLEVRGRKSLNAGGTPLIVLDGIIYYGSLEDINPTDIETIDVLKDASSAAVYGAKAANGVVMVTTKRGKTGKPSINIDANFGLATMAVNQPIYSPEGYLSIREDVMKSTNENAKPYQYSDPRLLPPEISVDEWLSYTASSGDPVNIWLERLNLKQVEIKNYMEGKSIDWYDMVFQNGKQQDYNVSLSSSKEDLSYYFSLGYQNNEGVVVEDKFSTIRSRLKLEGNVTDFLKVGINTQFSDRDESQVPVNWSQMVNVSPWGSMYTDDGKSLRLSPQDDPAVTANPMLNPFYTDRLQKYSNLISTLYAHVKLPFGLTYQLNFSPRFQWYKYFNHQSAEHPSWGLQGGLATRTQSEEYSWQVDNLLKWERDINEIHHFDVTFLANAEKFQNWRNTIDNKGFSPSDQLGYHNIGSGISPVVSSNDEYSTGDALMGRLFYSLKNRYMLTLSVRRDGYSAFGQKHPRAVFPSAALGWVFTDENFAKPEWLNYGKLRLSYGINGNRDIGRYVALAQLSSDNYIHIGPNDEIKKITTLEVSSMSNPELKWEKTAAYNLGLDFSILKSKINGNIELYNTSTTDLLVLRSLPRLVGYNSVITNLGEVQNKGFELNLNTNNFSRDNFSWRTAFNLSYNKNKIISLYGDMEDVLDANGNVIGQKELDDVTNKWFIGHAIDEIWDIKVLGVYQLDEAEQAAKYGVRPGDFKLEDVNNDGKYTDADRQFLGNTTPKFRGSLRNEFTFLKNLDVSFMLYSYWGYKNVFNEAKSLGNGYLDRTNYYVLPYWTSENPINDFAQLSSSNGSANYNVYRDKSFIRLDNISIAYNLPKSIIGKVGIQRMKVFANSRNVAFYAPEFFMWDPEYAGPTPRTFTFGINLTL